MSRVFDALRNVEQEAKARRATVGAGEQEESKANAAPPTEPATSEHSAKAEQLDPRQLQQQLGSLADRLEASRGRLEELIAQARQAQESAQGELARIEQKIQDLGLEATGAAAKIRAELLKELESLSQRVVEQAESRIEENAVAVAHRLDRAAESSLATAAASPVSTAVERVIQEMAERFGNDLGTIMGGFEKELQQKADRLVKSASELIREQADSSLNRFGMGLVTAGERARCESRKVVEELCEAAARSLKAEHDKQRDVMSRQLQKEASELARATLDRITASLGDASQVAREAVYKQVGQAAAVLKEWQDQARARLEDEVQKSLEAFGQQLAELSAGVLKLQRRRLGLWTDDLRARMQQADQALKGSSEGSQNPKGK